MKGGNEWENNSNEATQALVGTGFEYSNAQAAVDYGEQLLTKAKKHEDYVVATAYMAFGARYQAAISALVAAADAVLAYSPTLAKDSPDDYNNAVSALAKAKAAKEQAGKKPIIDTGKLGDR
jgi:hypothetical protein